MTVALIAMAAACIGIMLRLDRSLFIVRAQFSLRTLLILLAVAPPMGAGGYWAYNRLSPKPSAWFIQDGTPQLIGPTIREGYQGKLTRERGFIEVPDEPDDK